MTLSKVYLVFQMFILEAEVCKSREKKLNENRKYENESKPHTFCKNFLSIYLIDFLYIKITEIIRASNEYYLYGSTY